MTTPRAALICAALGLSVALLASCSDNDAKKVSTTDPTPNFTYPNKLTPAPAVPSIVSGSASNAKRKLFFGVTANPTVEPKKAP